MYSCRCLAHNRCLGFVSLVCPEAFHAERVRAAFVRCLASLLYTYRKQLGRPTKEQKATASCTPSIWMVSSRACPMTSRSLPQ